jgi:hypothetical protein
MNYFKSFFWLPIVAAILGFAVYFIFNSGPAVTCVLGFAMAAALFWMRETHTIFMA